MQVQNTLSFQSSGFGNFCCKGYYVKVSSQEGLTRGGKSQNMTKRTAQCFSQLTPINNQGHNLNKFLISLQMLKLQMLQTSNI